MANSLWIHYRGWGSVGAFLF